MQEVRGTSIFFKKMVIWSKKRLNSVATVRLSWVLQRGRTVDWSVGWSVSAQEPQVVVAVRVMYRAGGSGG